MFSSQPFDSDVGSSSQDQNDLRRMVLCVAQGIDQKLTDIQFVPPESASLPGTVFGQFFKHRFALLDAVIGVIEQLFLAVASIRRGNDSAILLVVTRKKVIIVLMNAGRIE